MTEQALTEEAIRPWLRRKDQPIICLDTVDSTNNYAKTRAAQGAPDGTAITAECQTGGRGRLGRSFQSPKGKGLYLTVLYRPHLPPSEAVKLTAYTALAVCAGVQAATGVRPGIKWTNDIVLNGKKLCGILTEMVTNSRGALDYVIAGLGVNVSHRPEDFSPDVAAMATSLAQELDRPIDRARLCGEILNAMERIRQAWLAGRGDILWARYQADCLTLGRHVRLLGQEEPREAFAEDIDRDFGLRVRYPDGRQETVTAGEVSVRGLYGYVESGPPA